MLETISYGTALALAVMGAFVALSPPDPHNKRALWGWLVAFTVMGVIALGAQYRLSERNKEEQAAAFDKLRKEITGEEHFAYFRVRPPVNNCEMIYLSFAQTGGVQDVAIGWFRQNQGGKYEDLTWRGELHNLIGEVAAQSFTIPEGQYKIFFRSPHNNWEQNFDLNCLASNLSEQIEVVRDGESLFRENNNHQITESSGGAR